MNHPKGRIPSKEEITILGHALKSGYLLKVDYLGTEDPEFVQQFFTENQRADLPLILVDDDTVTVNFYGFTIPEDYEEFLFNLAAEYEGQLAFFNTTFIVDSLQHQAMGEGIARAVVKTWKKEVGERL